MSDDLQEIRAVNSTIGDPPSVVIANGDDSDNIVENASSISTSGSPVAVGKGLSTLISTVIRDFDSNADATISSQDQLASALDRLTGELDQLLDAAPLPFIMQHAARISSVKKRVTSLNSVLKSIQHRVDNIDRMLSTGPLQVSEKGAKESGGQK